MELRKTGEDAYFAASNSEKGFFSYYRECFDAAHIQRVFAIKGGPGTGKSHFMRTVADRGRACGWHVEYVYCSSDADSLDGIILSKGDTAIALLDATAPHVYEPSRPGVREELIDLGAFWDRSQLLERVERIESLTRKKSEAYRRAYRYLHSEGQLLRIRDQLVSPYMKSQAIRAYAEKQMRDIPNGNLYGARPALVRSVGMRGEVIFDTYFASAQKSILLEDCYGSAQLFLEAIGELAVKKKLQIRVSHDPVFPDRLDGIFFTESRRAFVCVPRTVAPTECKRVSLRRFVQVGAMKPIRGKLLFAERMRKAMRAGALEALRDVQEAHFALEACYTSAMDFAAKERFTKNFCDVLFDLKK